MTSWANQPEDFGRGVDPRVPLTESKASHADLAGTSLRILLVEDDKFNRKVAMRQLVNWGHTVVVAVDGCEAVEAVCNDRFDVILMDVEMPNLDGFAAAARIRELEQGTMRTPIIAVTAHDQAQYEQKCRLAGMDDRVTKPIDFDELRRVIENVIAVRRPVVDAETLLLRVGGDTIALYELVDLFSHDLPDHLSDIAEAVESGDARSLFEHAHSLKGEVGFFTSGPALELLKLLEGMAGNNDLTNSPSACGELQEACHVLVGELSALYPKGSVGETG